MSGARGLRGLRRGVDHPLVLGLPPKSIRIKRMVSRVNVSRQKGQTADGVRGVAFSMIVLQHFKQNTWPVVGHRVHRQ